ncbi:MAG TPA: hypothetical protein VFS43_31530 [Polyangiaceae bacterium]|nr:hypothetical protein [Polyangiaceae bacterium]
MKIGANELARVGWQLGVGVDEAGGPGEAADVTSCVELGEGAPSVERSEGSVAGAMFGQNLRASAGAEGARAGGESARAGDEPRGGESARAGGEPGGGQGAGAAGELAGDAPARPAAAWQAGAPSLAVAAFWAGRGLHAAGALAAGLGPGAAGLGAGRAAAPLANATGASLGTSGPPAGAITVQERVHEWGRQLEREGPAPGRAPLRPGHHEPSRRSPEVPAEPAPARPLGPLAWEGAGPLAERLRAPPQGEAEAEAARREGARPAGGASEDAFVVHAVRRCRVRRLRFEVEASFYGARAACGFEFDDATYGRVTVEGGAADFLGRAAAAGHPSATRHVVALLRAFAAGDALAFPVAFEPAAGSGEREGAG